jgi:hypothetical protein
MEPSQSIEATPKSPIVISFLGGAGRDRLVIGNLKSPQGLSIVGDESVGAGTECST